jgi:hypothetical protein
MWDDGNGTSQSQEVKFKDGTVDEMLVRTKMQLGCQTFRTLSSSTMRSPSMTDERAVETGVDTLSVTTARAQHLRTGGSAASARDDSMIASAVFARESATLLGRLEDALHAMKFSLLQLYSGRQTTLNKKDLIAAKDWFRALLAVSERIFAALHDSITSSLQELLYNLSEKDTKSTFRQLLTTTGLLEKNEDLISLSAKGWKTCRDASGGGGGSHKRGFTCGLWTLFHLMASNVDTATKGKDVVRGVVQFIGNFFQCKECRTHFMAEYGEREYQRIEDSSDQSFEADDAARWLWRAHNGVNRRLRLSEPADSPWMMSYPSCDDCGIDCCSKRSDGFSGKSDDTTYNEAVALEYIQDIYCVDVNQPGFVCQRSGGSMLASSVMHQGEHHLLRPMTLILLRSWWYIVLVGFVLVVCTYSQKWQHLRREAYLTYWKTA